MMHLLRVLLLALLFAVPAQAATVAPSGGNDAGNIQAAVNFAKPFGTVQLCGSYRLDTGIQLVRNVAIQGCGASGCMVTLTQPGVFAFWFIYNPGDQLLPGYFELSGCIINANNQPNSVCVFTWTYGDYHDITQVIYGQRFHELECWNSGAIAMQIGRSMGTTLQDIYIKGGQNGIYCMDCGEFYASDIRGENMNGFVLFNDGNGNADSHWAEGAHVDRLIGNGIGYGWLIRNYGFVTGAHLDLTTMKSGPAMWLMGSVSNAYFTAFDIGGNTGQGGLAPQPGFLMDTGQPQPLGPFQRVTLAHGIIYGSAYGAQLSGVKVTVDDVDFTGNTNFDLNLVDTHDSSVVNSRMDNITSIFEQPSSGGNAFLNNVLHNMALQPGAIQRDNRAPTR